MTNISSSVSHALGALAIAALSAAPAAAQQAAKVQLAFGYECDNKFALRNEGTQLVNLEYAVAGTPERGTVSVKPNETVQLESASRNDVQLYVDGKLVATEKKGNRACAQAAVASTVTVRHLDQREVVYVQQAQVIEPVYVGPEVVYVRPWDYGYYYGPRLSVHLGFGFPIRGGWRGGPRGGGRHR